MIQDFAATDEVTLRCDRLGGLININAAGLQLGPLVELLIFRHRSLADGVQLKLAARDVPLSLALMAMPAGTTWAYEASGPVGALRVQSGSPSADDDVVQQRFLMDIRIGLERHGVPIKSAQALAGAAGELIDNVGQHAGTGCEALAAFEILDGSFWLAVGDCGVGVLSSYNGQPDIKTSQRALETSVIEHRSSTGDPERGMGFRQVLRSLQAMDASLRVRSDNASLEIEAVAISGRWFVREQTHLRGFVVSAHVKW